MPRRLLGTLSTLTVRKRVYLAADAVEVDEIEGYTGTRKRVLLDEVLLVTLDRRRRWLTVAIWGAVGALFSTPAILAAVGARTPYGFFVAAIFFAPFATVALWHLLIGVDYVTVFGKRSLAQMAFSLRKGRARRTFALLRDRVQQAQERARLSGSGAPPAPPGTTSAA